jgi:hypothetical protein
MPLPMNDPTWFGPTRKVDRSRIPHLANGLPRVSSAGLAGIEVKEARALQNSGRAGFPAARALLKLRYVSSRMTARPAAS